jgi:hypothetical protein
MLGAWDVLSCHVPVTNAILVACRADRDFRKPPVGWEKRKLLELEDAELDREIDDRPAFLVRKGNVSAFQQNQKQE